MTHEACSEQGKQVSPESLANTTGGLLQSERKEKEMQRKKGRKKEPAESLLENNGNLLSLLLEPSSWEQSGYVSHSSRTSFEL